MATGERAEHTHLCRRGRMGWPQPRGRGRRQAAGKLEGAGTYFQFGSPDGSLETTPHSNVHGGVRQIRSTALHSFADEGKRRRRWSEKARVGPHVKGASLIRLWPGGREGKSETGDTAGAGGAAREPPRLGGTTRFDGWGQPSSPRSSRPHQFISPLPGQRSGSRSHLNQLDTRYNSPHQSTPTQAPGPLASSSTTTPAIACTLPWPPQLTPPRRGPYHHPAAQLQPQSDRAQPPSRASPSRAHQTSDGWVNPTTSSSRSVYRM